MVMDVHVDGGVIIMSMRYARWSECVKCGPHVVMRSTSTWDDITWHDITMKWTHISHHCISFHFVVDGAFLHYLISSHLILLLFSCRVLCYVVLCVICWCVVVCYIVVCFVLLCVCWPFSPWDSREDSILSTLTYLNNKTNKEFVVASSPAQIGAEILKLEQQHPQGLLCLRYLSIYLFISIFKKKKIQIKIKNKKKCRTLKCQHKNQKTKY